LLRWSDIGPAELVTALEARFAGVGLPENTELFLADNAGRREYITKDTRFGMIMHTFIHEDTITHDKMFAQACRRLQFLAEKLVEDLTAPEKIFVYKYTLRPLTPEEVNAIHRALRRFGDATLLNVTKADDGHETGSVEQIDDGLLMGYIDHFASELPGGRIAAVTDSWAVICRNAHRLWRDGSRTTRTGDVPNPSDDSKAQRVL
jgi:hypothetical protein